MHNTMQEWVPVKEMQIHVETACPITLQRNECAERSRLKSDTQITCRSCGQKFPQKDARRHYDEECTSRIVACPNASLGCPEHVRFRDVHRYSPSRPSCRTHAAPFTFLSHQARRLQGSRKTKVFVEICWKCSSSATGDDEKLP